MLRFISNTMALNVPWELEPEGHHGIHASRTFRQLVSLQGGEGGGCPLRPYGEVLSFPAFDGITSDLGGCMRPNTREPGSDAPPSK